MYKGALNYKLFLAVAALTAGVALAGPGGGGATPDVGGPQSDGSFDFAPGNSPAHLYGLPALDDNDPKVKVRVKVQLAGEGAIGHVKVEEKQRDGSFKTIVTCKSSNSFHTVLPGPGVTQPAFRTPEGRYQPLDLSTRLLYPPIGDWDPMGPATYYMAIADKATGRKREFAALHNGHQDGLNSHGCVRMQDACANQVGQEANDNVLLIPADENGKFQNSIVFGNVETALWSGLSPSGAARHRRDFSAIAIDLRWDWNGNF